MQGDDEGVELVAIVIMGHAAGLLVGFWIEGLDCGFRPEPVMLLAAGNKRLLEP
ncbi:hypothetical protein D3C73_452500 [compost metagenome]